MRSLLCRLFRLQKREEAHPWGELLAAKDYRPVWPRIVNSEVWKRDLQPWYEQALLFTLFRLAQSRDPGEITRLQVRAELINEWLEQPRLAMIREDAALANLGYTGTPEEVVAGVERANVRAYGRRN